MKSSVCQKRLKLTVSLFVLSVGLTLIPVTFAGARIKSTDRGQSNLVGKDRDTRATTALTNEDKAYLYLDEVMDRFHNTFDVYTDADAGGNHYVPSGWMGDWGDISYDADSVQSSHSGLTCIRIGYSAKAAQGNNWAGIYWQHPENNWGTVEGGYDLRGATNLSFWAKGGKGGEWIDFKVGGINRAPYYDSTKPYQDSFGSIGTGYVQLSNTWQQYVISLDKDYFDVYRDQHTSYVPSGWMGDTRDIAFDDSYVMNPYLGRTCIRITYSARATQGYNWAGIYWQHPENNWGDNEGGFDLTGFERITFWAKGEKDSEQVEFFAFGIGRDREGRGNPIKPYYDSSPKVSLGHVALTNTWKQYVIDLAGKDLSRVIGGFGWAADRYSNPSGCTFYLDDIRYERRLTDPDLSKVIGGFCWVTNKDSNPSGCTFYLDDIKYDKARLDDLRFLSSYQVVDPIAEKPLVNTAFTYDNTLAMLAYMARGTTDDWRRARIIGDTLVYYQNHDRDYPDGWLRNAYRSGDIADSPNGKALLPGWWDDQENKWLEDKEAISSSTGNVAWAMIALLTYCQNRGSKEYLQAAEKMGEWIETNCRDARGEGGYTGGYLGWAPDLVKAKWKSTEHNIDLYVAFTRLFKVTGDGKWQERADHAKNFVEAMWNPQAGHFWTGTLDDGVTINKDVIPEDVQSWGSMALGEVGKYAAGVTWAEDNCREDHTCPNSPPYPDFTGFDFNDDRDGVWFEGTAHMALAYLLRNQSGDQEKRETYLNEIRKAQALAKNSNGKGIVAACHDGLTTGFYSEYGPITYNDRLHVGATAWYILAERGYNPFDTTPPARVSDLAVASRSTSSVALSWSAPGDDETSGTATEYDLRYSTSPIVTASDFAAATEVADEPVPLTSGTVQSCTVTGLNPETSYHFALKARDEVFNWSSLSNRLNIYTLIVGDITKDGTVNIFDLVRVGKAFGSVPGNPNWDSEADVKTDGVINIFDLVAVGKNFGRSVPPPQSY